MKTFAQALALLLIFWTMIALGSIDNLNGYPLGKFLLLYIALPVGIFAALLLGMAGKARK